MQILHDISISHSHRAEELWFGKLAFWLPLWFPAMLLLFQCYLWGGYRLLLIQKPGNETQHIHKSNETELEDRFAEHPMLSVAEYKPGVCDRPLCQTDTGCHSIDKRRWRDSEDSELYISERVEKGIICGLMASRRQALKWRWIGSLLVLLIGAIGAKRYHDAWGV